MSSDGKAERFLRMIGVADFEAAASLLEDTSASIHRRCLAARALSFARGECPPKALQTANPRDDSALSRACWKAYEKWRRYRRSQWDREDASAAMRELGIDSASDAVHIFQDSSRTAADRLLAANVVGWLKHREGVAALVAVLAEGEDPICRAAGMHCDASTAGEPHEGSWRSYVQIGHSEPALKRCIHSGI